MLPGFNSSQFNPGDSLGEAPNYSSSSPAATSYQGQPPSRAREANPQQGCASSPSDYEEDSSFSAADDGPADEEAAAAAAVEAAAGYGDSSADEEVQQNTAVPGTAYKSIAAALGSERASQDSACLSEDNSRLPVQSPESYSAESRTRDPEAMTKAPEAMTKMPEAMTHMSEKVVQSAAGGNGILDEYRVRMHYLKEDPMAGPLSGPTPPLGAPASVSRRWAKTNSYPDGQSSSTLVCSCSPMRQEQHGHEIYPYYIYNICGWYNGFSVLLACKLDVPTWYLLGMATAFTGCQMLKVTFM